jgi:hypothetical protein
MKRRTGQANARTKVPSVRAAYPKQATEEVLVLFQRAKARPVTKRGTESEGGASSMLNNDVSIFLVCHEVRRWIVRWGGEE